MLKKFRQKLGADGHLKELLKGSLITFLLKMIGMAFAYLSIYLISRKTGSEGVGIYSIISQILLVLAVIGSWGTSTSVLRYVGQHHERNPDLLRVLRIRLLGLIVPISVFLGALIFFNAPLLAEFAFRNPAYTQALKITGILLPFFALNSVDTEFIRGLKILKISELIRSVFRPLLLVLALLLLWKETLDALDVIYLFAATVVLSTVFSSSVLHYQLGKLPRHTSENILTSEIFKTSGPMMVSGITATLMTALPLFWIEYDGSSSNAGIYGVALRLAALISLVLMVVNTMAAPKFSAMYWNKEHEALQRLLHQSAKLMFWTALLLSAAMLLLSQPLLRFFGEEYLEGQWALGCLVIGQFINTATGSVGLLLNMSGQQRLLRNSSLFALAVQLVLLYALIPRYGVLGGAIAFTLSSSIWNIICILYAYRRLNLRTFYFPFIH